MTLRLWSYRDLRPGEDTGGAAGPGGALRPAREQGGADQGGRLRASHRDHPLRSGPQCAGRETERTPARLTWTSRAAGSFECCCSSPPALGFSSCCTPRRGRGPRRPRFPPGKRCGALRPGRGEGTRAPSSPDARGHGGVTRSGDTPFATLISCCLRNSGPLHCLELAGDPGVFSEFCPGLIGRLPVTTFFLDPLLE